MEYGLMLRLNKYVIPFQRSTQQLPFNVSGLDTIKYENASFEILATKAIDKVIGEAKQQDDAKPNLDRVLLTYLLSRNLVVSTLSNDDEKSLFELRNVCGFNLLNDFAGLTYIYFGNFAHVTADVILWRLRKLAVLLQERSKTLPRRIAVAVPDEQRRAVVLEAATAIFDSMEIWVLVASDEDRTLLNEAIGMDSHRAIEMITVQEVWDRIESELPMK
jgi:hypothetical protein